jgi:hypothetical protein
VVIAESTRYGLLSGPRSGRLSTIADVRKPLVCFDRYIKVLGAIRFQMLGKAI